MRPEKGAKSPYQICHPQWVPAPLTPAAPRYSAVWSLWPLLCSHPAQLEAVTGSLHHPLKMMVLEPPASTLVSGAYDGAGTVISSCSMGPFLSELKITRLFLTRTHAFCPPLFSLSLSLFFSLSRNAQETPPTPLPNLYDYGCVWGV